MNNFIHKILSKLISSLNKLNNWLIQDKNKVEILSIAYNTNGRFITFTIDNPFLLDNHQVLLHIFNKLMNTSEFTSR